MEDLKLRLPLHSGEVEQHNEVTSLPTIVASISVNAEGNVSGSFSAGIDISSGEGINISFNGSYGSVGINNYEEYSFGSAVGFVF